jgi:hypothetical protein
MKAHPPFPIRAHPRQSAVELLPFNLGDLWQSWQFLAIAFQLHHLQRTRFPVMTGLQPLRRYFHASHFKDAPYRGGHSGLEYVAS